MHVFYIAVYFRTGTTLDNFVFRSNQFIIPIFHALSNISIRKDISGFNYVMVFFWQSANFNMSLVDFSYPPVLQRVYFF